MDIGENQQLSHNLRTLTPLVGGIPNPCVAGSSPVGGAPSQSSGYDWVRLRLKCLSIICLFLLLFPFFAQAQAQITVAFIGAGQSNFFGPLSGKYRALPPNLHFYIGARRVKQIAPTDRVGPEYSFLMNYCASHPEEKVIFIKCAYGGTSLTSLHWLPPQGPLYRWMVRCVQMALIREGVSGYPITGMLWTQGEWETAHALISARMYGYHLRLLVAAVRSHFHSPEMPFIFAQTNWPTARWNDVVRAQQAQAAETIPFAVMVPVEGLPVVGGANYHFTLEGEEGLGERMWQAFEHQ